MKGIYKIVNTTNGKYYVGSSMDIRNRWWSHKTHLNKGDHDNDYLQKSWNKHGPSSFVLQIVEEVSNAQCRKDLLVCEQKYLDIARLERKKTYNLNWDAQGGILDEYSKDKIRGKNNPMYGLRGPEHPSYGYKHTQAERDAISRAKIGIPRTMGVRKSLSDFQKKRFASNPESHPACSTDIHTFIHTSGEKFTGTQFQFRRKYDLSSSKISMLTHRTRKFHREWSLIT